MRLKLPYALAIAVRVLISVSTRTFFQPDEYFQCLEPAHHIAFGYGHLTWEWVSSKPIRSVAYPAIWAWLFKLLAWAGFDSDAAIILAPKVLSGLLASLTDIYLIKLTHSTIGAQYTHAVLYLSLTSFFHSLALTRTLATSLETVLTTVSLYHWCLGITSGDRIEIRKALLVAALSCVLRPTGAIMWLYLFFDMLILRRVGLWFIRDCLSIGVFAILVAAAIDTYHLRAQKGDLSLSLSIINFISVNSSAISQFYGRMPWHYYLTQAMPLLCTSSLPFAIKGLINAFNRGDKMLRLLVCLVAWTTSVYSAISHKEWRFLHPLLPVMHVFAAKSMVDGCSSRRVGNSSRRWFGLGGMYLILPLLTLPLSIYVIRYHGRGQVAVMEHLRSISRPELHSVGFLMPCHSTPMQSYLHRPHLDEGHLWAIGCEPPLRPTIDIRHGRRVPGTGPNVIYAYKDQSDVFYEEPLHYLESFFPQQVDPAFPPSPMPTTPPGEISSTWEGFRSWNHTWPSHLVFFGALLGSPGVKTLLEQQGYIVSWKIGNGFEEDVRRRGGVEVWSWSSSHTPQLN